MRSSRLNLRRALMVFAWILCALSLGTAYAVRELGAKAAGLPQKGVEPDALVAGATAMAVAFALVAVANAEEVQRRLAPLAGWFFRADRVQVFISYAEEEADLARALKDLAAKRGVRAFLARDDVDHGSLWRDCLLAALHECDEVWILVTHTSVTRTWVLMEVGAGWGLQKRIVPVRHAFRREDLIPQIQPYQSPDFEAMDMHIAKSWPA